MLFLNDLKSFKFWMKRNQLIPFNLLALCAIIFLLFSTVAWAALDDDDEMFQNVRRSSVGKSRGSAYLGARDEQSLEVQPSLAQPSRNPDGTSIVQEDDDGPQVDAADTD